MPPATSVRQNRFSRELMPAFKARRVAKIVFRAALGAVDNVFRHPDQPADLAHAVEDPAVSAADIAVVSGGPLRVRRKPADSFAGWTLHHRAPPIRLWIGSAI
jgi:hypothetical protein